LDLGLFLFDRKGEMKVCVKCRQLCKSSQHLAISTQPFLLPRTGGFCG
jgi:hypothetical protein